MLPYKNRLIASKNFEAVHRYGSFFSFGSIFLKVKKNNTDQIRIGVLVGVSFSKKATGRNRLKRQLREAAKKQLGKIKKGLDIVIMIKKGKQSEIDFKILEGDLKSALEKGNLIN